MSNTDTYSRLKRVLHHLRHGTLRESLNVKWTSYNKARQMAWWQANIGKPFSTITEVEPGIRMQLYCDCNLSRLIYQGYFELEERQFLQNFLRLGDVFVDVGANIGLFTLIAAHCIGKNGKVFAFEPVAKTYQRLRANVDINNLANVSCHQLALSDNSGESVMNVSLDGHDAWNSLAKPTSGSEFSQETITTVRWNDFAREHQLAGAVTLMKIDVEGWEAHVLLGGREFFALPTAPTLLVEFTDRNAHAAGTTCQALYRELEGLGYQMFSYDAETDEIRREVLRDSYPYLNLIATKDESAVLHRLRNGAGGEGALMESVQK